MGDHYWKYGAAASAVPPSSSDRGREAKAHFPGYLSSETSTLTNYDSYSSFDRRAGSSDFLRKDHLPSRPGAYGVEDIAGIGAEPGASGLIPGAYKGYPSSFEDTDLLARYRDVPSGISPGIPDVGYERPTSLRRPDSNPIPAAESNVLFVDGLPTDCTRRELGRILASFLVFMG